MKALVTLLLVAAMGLAQADDAKVAAPGFDAELAQKLGADDHGMRSYVLVILKTGPNKMPAGAERDAMFKGHFANIQRLAAEGKLVLAGPFGGEGDWRGMFVFDVKTVDEAKALTATDPVIKSGEMIAEYHPYYGSAALKLVNDAHAKIQKKSF